MHHKNLVTIVTVESREKAEMFQAILERHGILVFVAPNDKVRVLGEVTISRQPFDVMVGKRSVTEAMDVLQSRKTQAVPAADGDLDITVVTCPHCRERILVRKSLLEAQKKCPKCGADLPGQCT
jgi:hypothetical protein